MENHQRDAALRLSRILEHRRGALLADSVGLGKTHVAIELIRQSLDHDQPTLVIAPAALRAHWQKHLRLLLGPRAGRCSLLSHTALSLGRLPALRPALIVVDEAHQFRNPLTRRYRALRALAQEARLLLVTATPINNRLADLHSLLRLFAPDSAFADIGLASLDSVFGAADARALAQVDRVVAAVVVRRTRDQIPLTATAFPTRSLESIRYDLPSITQLLAAIGALSLRWSAGSDNAPELVRLQLLKRLESSSAALAHSATRLLRIGESCLAALRAGALPDLLAIKHTRADTEHQLAFDLLLFPPGNVKRDDWDRAALESDITILHEILRLLDAADAKLAALRQRIAQLHDQPILLFTQFRDTALMLWRGLRLHRRLGLVTGTDARLGDQPASRAAVIASFAPRSSGARDSLVRTDLLVTTDVLAEGMNLQDASVVINYDLPWNPITLVQRAGRIDRIGSAHSQIRVISVLPDRSLELWLRLLRTIERKLVTIDRLISGDAAVLASNAIAALQPVVASDRHNGLPALDRIERLRRAQAAPESSRARPGSMAAFTGPLSISLVAVREGAVVRLLISTGHNLKEDLGFATGILEHALDASESRCPDAIDLDGITQWLEADRIATRLRSHPRPEPVSYNRSVFEVIGVLQQQQIGPIGCVDAPPDPG